MRPFRAERDAPLFARVRIFQKLLQLLHADHVGAHLHLRRPSPLFFPLLPQLLLPQPLLLSPHQLREPPPLALQLFLAFLRRAHHVVLADQIVRRFLQKVAADAAPLRRHVAPDQLERLPARRRVADPPFLQQGREHLLGEREVPVRPRHHAVVRQNQQSLQRPAHGGIYRHGLLQQLPEVGQIELLQIHHADDLLVLDRALHGAADVVQAFLGVIVVLGAVGLVRPGEFGSARVLRAGRVGAGRLLPCPARALRSRRRLCARRTATTAARSPQRVRNLVLCFLSEKTLVHPQLHLVLRWQHHVQRLVRDTLRQIEQCPLHLVRVLHAHDAVPLQPKRGAERRLHQLLRYAKLPFLWRVLFGRVQAGLVRYWERFGRLLLQREVRSANRRRGAHRGGRMARRRFRFLRLLVGRLRLRQLRHLREKIVEELRDLHRELPLRQRRRRAHALQHRFVRVRQLPRARQFLTQRQYRGGTAVGQAVRAHASVEKVKHILQNQRNRVRLGRS
mmetsp:Transcript_10599/g.25858  ORF Transcript_10599/g.25858 Transcript_10599/m.25858 type:complete len:506 (+) Transcript_10599:3413-4930(+)